jgi:hypothetical protein
MSEILDTVERIENELKIESDSMRDELIKRVIRYEEAGIPYTFPMFMYWGQIYDSLAIARKYPTIFKVEHKNNVRGRIATFFAGEKSETKISMVR